jgi:hypothetical protein
MLESTNRLTPAPNKADAFKRYSEHYVATTGQLYYSDAHQFADYTDGYHAQVDALTEEAPGSLCEEHGYRIPPRRAERESQA